MSYAAEHCTKRTHATKALAEGHILLLQRAGKAHAHMHAYWCAGCGGWHVGREHDVYNPVSRADWTRPDRRC